MNKTAKALLIPVAAFAVTATGVSAFNPDVLEEAGLSNTQIAAFEEAKELKDDGDRAGARDVLVDAGIDRETMQSIRETAKEYRAERREAIHEALDNEDYEAFLEAAEGSPLFDVVSSLEDFELLVEAHELKEAGEHEEAKEIMEELGFEKPKHGHGKRFGHGPKSEQQ